jgi:hypothetical protein
MALKSGAYTAFVLNILVAFGFGFGGYIAGLYGLVDFSDPNQINSAFFGILRSPDLSIPLGTLTLISLITAVLNQCSIDSFQTGILDVVAAVPDSLWEYDIPVLAARTIAIILNIPLIVIGCLGFNVTKLFLLTHILLVSSVLPLVLGLMPLFDHFLTGNSALFGSLTGILSVFVLGAATHGSFAEGVQAYFFSSYYDWRPFLLAITTSLIGTFFFAFLEMIYRVSFDRPLVAKHLQKSAESDVFVQRQGVHDVDDEFY